MFLSIRLPAPSKKNRSFKESLYEKEKNINRLIMYFTIWREMLLKAEFVSYLILATSFGPNGVD